MPVTSLPRNKAVILFVVGALLLATPLFILAATVQQDLRTQAAKKDLTCSPVQSPKGTAVQSLENSNATLQQLKRSETTLSKMLKQYQSAKGTSNNTLKSSIKKNANSRKSLLAQLIRQNPKGAFDYLESNKTNEKNIINTTSECGAVPTSIDGTLTVSHGDYPKTNKSTYFYTLTTKNKKKIALYPTGELSKPLISRMQIKATGYALGNDMLLNAKNHDSITGGLSSASVDSSQGEQKTVVIVIDPALSKEQVNTHIFTTINDYYQQTSYGKMSLSGKTYGPYSVADLGCDANGIPLNAQNAISAADSDADFTGVSRIVIFGQFSCGWGGYGLQGLVNSYTTNEGSGPFSVAWVNSAGNNEPFSGIAGHEMGHNFGVDHAVSMDCPNGGICDTFLEYGNAYDIMGGFRNLGQMGAPHRDYIGWFDGSNIQTINKSGSYTIKPIETDGDDLKALKIPRGGDDFLYVEYRQPIDTDKNFEKIEGTNIFDGALLQVLQDGNPQRPAIFDPTEPHGVGVSVQKAALLPDESFTDPTTGTVVKVTKADSTELTVDVDYKGPDISVAPQPTTSDTTPTPNPCELTPTPIESGPTPEDSGSNPDQGETQPTDIPNTTKREKKSSIRNPRNVVIPTIKKPVITVVVPKVSIKKPTIIIPTPKKLLINFPDIFPFIKNTKPKTDIGEKVRSNIATPKPPRKVEITVSVKKPTLPDTRKRVQEQLKRAGIQSIRTSDENPCDPTPTVADETPTPTPAGGAAGRRAVKGTKTESWPSVYGD